MLIVFSWPKDLYCRQYSYCLHAMKKNIPAFLVITLIIVGIVMFFWAFGDRFRTVEKHLNEEVERDPLVAGCGEDTKTCPDGTVVGRIRPNCDFLPCPQDN